MTARNASWAAFLLALVAVVYGGTLDNQFVFDDKVVVQERGRTGADAPLWSQFSRSYWDDERIDSLYRPLTTMSYVLNYRWSGDSPRAYHVVNVAVHVACCVALFALTIALFGDRRIAAGASALFAVHALHVEPVVQVVGRAELLATFFGLTGLCLYVSDARQSRRRPGWRSGAAFALFAVSALSKESGLAFPVVAAFFDLWSRRFSPSNRPGAPRSEISVRFIAWRWAGILGVVASVLVLRIRILGMLVRDSSRIALIDNPLASATFDERWFTPFVLLERAVRLMIWPNPLSHDYSFDAIPLADTVFDPRVLAGLACVAAMGVASALSFRRRGRVLFCTGFFLLTYGIVSNTVVLAGTIFGERLLYAPSVAACWLLASFAVAGADRLSSTLSAQRGAWAAASLFAAMCVVHGGLALARGRDWRSEMSLIESALPVVGNSTRVQAQAGTRLLGRGRLQPAIQHLRRSVEIWDGNYPAHYQLGGAYLRAGQAVRAIPHLKRAARRFPPELAHLPQYDLGRAYRTLDNPEKAAKWFAAAARQQPNAPQILAAWASALAESGDRDAAVRILQRAVEAAPPPHPRAASLRRQLETLQRK